jgi:hypothetical protein
MLRSVDFDDQSRSNAKKVDDVRSNRNLPPKLEAAQPSVAQEAPETKLGVGRSAAHRSGAGALVQRDAGVGLHRGA